VVYQHFCFAGEEFCYEVAQYSIASDSSATEGEFCGIVIERKEDGSVVPW
jgi:hypothetical protein